MRRRQKCEGEELRINHVKRERERQREREREREMREKGRNRESKM